MPYVYKEGLNLFDFMNFSKESDHSGILIFNVLEILSFDKTEYEGRSTFAANSCEVQGFTTQLFVIIPYFLPNE
jgi:hypothetical protein